MHAEPAESALTCTATGSVRSMTQAPPLSSVEAVLAGLPALDWLEATYTDLHAHPELSHREHRSARVAKAATAGLEKGAPEDGEHQWQALLRGIPEKLPVSRRQWPLVKNYARQLSS